MLPVRLRLRKNPSNKSPSAALLLGLLHVNASKDPLHPGGSPARTAAYARGLALIQQAFKRDNTSPCAAAMAPLASHLVSTSSGPPGAALKLAERMLAFADARLLVAEAHLARARALDADPSTGPFAAHELEQAYARAVEANPDLVMAHLGLAGVHIRTEQFPQAIHVLEGLLRRHPRCVEALVALASIHTHLAFTFHSVSDSAGARKNAKQAYEQVLRVFAAGKDKGSSGAAGGGGLTGEDLTVAKSERVRALAADRDLYVEIARLWADDEPSVEKSLQAWLQAARIEQDRADEAAEDAAAAAVGGAGGAVKAEGDGDEGAVDPRIRNNVAVLYFNRRNGTSSAALDPSTRGQAHLVRAQAELEMAAAKLGAQLQGTFDGGETDAAVTVVGFNLAAVREALGDVEKARSEWTGLLQVHPEFVEGARGHPFPLSRVVSCERNGACADTCRLLRPHPVHPLRAAKARLALLAIKSRQRDQLDIAHTLIKEALTSQPQNPELRALYTFFLMETNQPLVARDCARATLKEVHRHDVYALCASGAVYYLEARENKSQARDAHRDRHARFTRAAEFFDKALAVAPQCAFAAQGLAIGLAEGSFGNGPAEGAPAPAAGADLAASGASAAAAAQQQPLTESQARARNTRDALNVLTKVKESINDASVYINIGHCHFQRREYDRAVENVRSLLLVSSLPSLRLLPRLTPSLPLPPGRVHSTRRRRGGTSTARARRRCGTSRAPTSTRPSSSRTLRPCSAPSSTATRCVSPLSSPFPRVLRTRSGGRVELTAHAIPRARACAQAADLAPGDLVSKYNMALLKQTGLAILSQVAVEKRTSAELKAAYEHLQSALVCVPLRPRPLSRCAPTCR